MNSPQLNSLNDVQRRGSTKVKNTTPQKRGRSSKKIDSRLNSGFGGSHTLLRVSLPRNANTTIEVDQNTTAQQLLEEICRKKRLPLTQHFLRAKNDQNATKATTIVSELRTNEVEICEKAVIKFTLTKEGGQPHGFNIVGEDPDSRARGVYVLSIDPLSAVAGKGLLAVGDHILSVDGKNTSSMGFLEICDKLRSQSVELIASTKRQISQEDSDNSQFYELAAFDFEAAADHRTIFLTMAEVDELGCRPVPPELTNAIDTNTLTNTFLSLPTKTVEPLMELPIKTEGINIEELIEKVKQLTIDCTTLILKPGQAGPGKMTKEALRACVLYEILQTEIQYLADLKELMSHYIEPLKAQGLLSEPERIILENNTKDLIELHTLFLFDLEPAIDFEIDPPDNVDEMKEEDKPKYSTAEVFSLHMHEGGKFTAYSVYCRSYPEATQIVATKGTDDPGFSAFLKERNPDFEQSKSLESFLIKPVQRILKYPLLLRDLEKHTGNGGAGGVQQQVSDALSASKAVAAEINEIQRESDKKAKGREILKQMDWGGYDELNGHCGDIIYNSEVLLIEKVGKNGEPHECYLYQHRLLLCKKRKKESSKVVDHFPVETLIARDLNNDDGKFLWCVVDRASGRTINLESKSAEEKGQWLSTTRFATKELLKLKQAQQPIQSQTPTPSPAVPQ